MTNVSLLRFFKEENTSIVNITRIVLGTKKYNCGHIYEYEKLHWILVVEAFYDRIKRRPEPGNCRRFFFKKQHVGFINIIQQTHVLVTRVGRPWSPPFLLSLIRFSFWQHSMKTTFWLSLSLFSWYSSLWPESTEFIAGI
jgi:hypothetical protein